MKKQLLPSSSARRQRHACAAAALAVVIREEAQKEVVAAALLERRIGLPMPEDALARFARAAVQEQRLMRSYLRLLLQAEALRPLPVPEALRH